MCAAAAVAPCCFDAIGFSRANITKPLQSMPLVNLINLLCVAWFFLLKMFSPDKEVAAVIRPSLRGVPSNLPVLSPLS